MSAFKLALIQMRVEGGAREDNVARALAKVLEAARAGAQVVLLPEALTTGWTHSSAHQDAEEIEGATPRQLRAAAARHGIYLCAGFIERAGDQLFNAAVLIDPAGSVRLHHRKIYELSIAHSLYASGHQLGVVETPLAAFGLMICADGFAPNQTLTRALALMGAQVILSPCAWAVPADHDQAREPYGRLWRDNYGPVAREFHLWIAGASNVGWINDGPWSGRKCIGCSLVVGPDGEPAVQGPYGVDAEAILYGEIDPVPRARAGPPP